MNNSLDRLLEGICAALRRDVIPRLSDEYATGQTLAVIDLINNLKPRLDWAVPPLVERAKSQLALVSELEQLPYKTVSDHPRFDTSLKVLPIDGLGLQKLCDRLDGHISAMVRWLGTTESENAFGNDGQSCEVAEAARAAITSFVHIELRRDMALTVRPLFAEIARGADGDGTPATTPSSSF